LARVTLPAHLEIPVRPVYLVLSVLWLTALPACTVRTSSVQVAGGGGSDNLPATCTWATVSETTTTKLLTIPLGTSVRQFDDAIFLCCTGENNAKPVCSEAKWFVIEGGD